MNRLFALIKLLMMLVVVHATQLVSAQENSSAFTVEELDTRIVALDTDTTLTDIDKTEARDILTRARNLLTQSNVRSERINQLVDEAANVDTILSELETELVAAQAEPEIPVEPGNIDSIRSLLFIAESELSSMVVRGNELRTEQNILSGRSSAIAEEIATANRQLEELQQVSATDASETVNLLEDARRVFNSVRQTDQRRLINDLQLELGTISARQAIVSYRLNIAEAEINGLNTTVARLSSILSETNRGRAELAGRTAQADLRRFADPASILNSIAQENLNLARELVAIVASNPRLAFETANLRQQIETLQQSNDTVNQILATGSQTDELGELMLSVRSSLPRVATLRQRISNNEESRVSSELNQILWRDRLQRLSDSTEAATRLLTTGTNALDASEITPEILAEAIELVQRRQSVLQELIDAAQIGSVRLEDQAIAINEALIQSEELSTVLNQRLLWLRNNASDPRNMISNLPSGLTWILSLSSWINAISTLVAQIARHWLIALPAVLLPLALIWRKRRLKTRLETLSECVGKVGRDTYMTTPEALLICLILALPAPIFLATISWLLANSDAPEPLTQALAPTLGSLSLLLFVILLFRTMAKTNGVFVTHFNWSATASRSLRRHLSWFAWFGGLSAFVYTMAISANDPSLRYGLGMISFAAGSIAIAVLSFQFFKPTGGVIAGIVEETPATPVLIFLFPFLVLIPLVLGMLPFIGYFDAAIQLQSNVFVSVLLFFAAAILYGLAFRLLMIGHRRLALQLARERRAKQEAERTSSVSAEASGEATPVSLVDVDLEPEKISSQIRNLLYILAAVVFGVGLWALWRPLLPALGIADDLILWETITLIEGGESLTSVTLWNIILSLVFLFGGFIAARNIRGFLEIGIFSRTKLDAGARYATVTIASYVLIAIGVIGSFSQLGIDWSRLQWIIAALGVGLGFGLQEIVANFVSGLIILFERPVRVGDLVTIGNLSGTVSSIRIRATTITDFDNHEVLLPNKTIITENVINWTLSDSVTRIIIKIGVAYGSDVNRVREILMEEVSKQPDVLEIPAPTIFFMNHGESSLDFDIRVFFSPPTKRFIVKHDLNVAFNQALAANGIVIPFPQRDIHVKEGG